MGDTFWSFGQRGPPVCYMSGKKDAMYHAPTGQGAGAGLMTHPPGRLGNQPIHYDINHSKTPTTQAAMREDRAPPNMATSPSRERSERRVGAMPLMPPTWMATLEKLAKPHRA